MVSGSSSASESDASCLGLLFLVRTLRRGLPLASDFTLSESESVAETNLGLDDELEENDRDRDRLRLFELFELERERCEAELDERLRSDICRYIFMKKAEKVFISFSQNFRFCCFQEFHGFTIRGLLFISYLYMGNFSGISFF